MGTGEEKKVMTTLWWCKLPHCAMLCYKVRSPLSWQFLILLSQKNKMIEFHSLPQKIQREIMVSGCGNNKINC